MKQTSHSTACNTVLISILSLIAVLVAINIIIVSKRHVVLTLNDSRVPVIEKAIGGKVVDIGNKLALVEYPDEKCYVLLSIETIEVQHFYCKS